MIAFMRSICLCRGRGQNMLLPSSNVGELFRPVTARQPWRVKRIGLDVMSYAGMLVVMTRPYFCLSARAPTACRRGQSPVGLMPTAISAVGGIGGSMMSGGDLSNISGGHHLAAPRRSRRRAEAISQNSIHACRSVRLRAMAGSSKILRTCAA